MAAARMGEMVISSVQGDELVAIGLGSCIGLALVDQSAGIAALAHVVLPDSQAAAGPAAKFANLAVPALLSQVLRAGAQKARLHVVIVGGARMFALGGTLDIGARNTAAVRQALSSNQLRVHAEEVGGNRGRTVRVAVGAGTVTVAEAGGKPVTLLAAGHRSQRQQPSAAPVGFGARGARS
jgi:chemotaxis protein CheD